MNQSPILFKINGRSGKSAGEQLNQFLSERSTWGSTIHSITPTRYEITGTFTADGPRVVTEAIIIVNHG